VFLGTAAFAVPSLVALQEAGHRIALVVSQPDRPAGRGLRLQPSPVKLSAQSQELPLFQPPRISHAAAGERIASLHPDLLVVVAYGQILPPPLLALARIGAVNVHASLLPRHRGPAPIAWSILRGDTETGVTIIIMDAGVDTGPILAQRRTPIEPHATARTLEERLAALGAELLVETVARLAAGALTPTPQPPQGATRAPRLRSEDGRLTPALTAVEIDRRVRALGTDPGCWITLAGGAVKVLRGHVAVGGDLGDGLAVPTPQGTYVIDELQLAGGRPMSAAAYRRGHR